MELEGDNGGPVKRGLFGKRRKPKRPLWKSILIDIGAVLVVALILGGIYAYATRPGNGQPWIDSDIAGLVKAGSEISLKDDFHAAVNREWLASEEIPEGYTEVSSFTQASDKSEEKLLALLKDGEGEGHDYELVTDFYNAYLNWDARDKAGVEPLKEMVDEIREIWTIGGLKRYICDVERTLGANPLVTYVNIPSLDDAGKYIVDVSGGGFILQDAAEYSKPSATGRLLKNAYRNIAVYMLGRLGYSEKEAKDLFDMAIGFEKELASVSMTEDEKKSPDYISRINNPYTMKDAVELAGNYPLDEETAALGYGEAKLLMIEEPEYFRKLNELWTDGYLEAIKADVIVRLAINRASVLDRACFDKLLEISNSFSGASGAMEDERYALASVEGVLGEPMARIYMQKYECEGMKGQVEDICREIIGAYREMLGGNTWLSEATREKAIEKLDNIKINAVYPDKWLPFYDSIDFGGKSLWDCVSELRLAEQKYDASRTNGSVEEGFWEMSPLDCNAFYNPQDNSINILLGILNEPFWHEGMSVEEMLGGIGAIIGHEISHAFDPTGAKFDKDGNVADWWTDEDMNEFRSRTEKLADYYSKIKPFGIFFVKGGNVQGEATADIAGVKAVLQIAEGIDGFDYDVFFRQYADNWKIKTSKVMEMLQNNMDEHPLNYLRTNVTLQQFDKFFETYGIGEGDGMFLPEENRISVW